MPRPLWWGLAGTALVRLVVYLRFMRHVALSGDEPYYWNSARYIVDLAVGGGDVPRGELVTMILQRGWFMPGVSALLAPIRLVSDDPAVGRLWMGALNFVLLIVVIRLVVRHLGPRVAWFVWSICTLMPLMVVFSFAFWGESLAGALVVIVTFATVSEAERLPDVDRLWRWALLGAGLAALVYIRPSMIIISVVLAGAVVVLSWNRSGWRALLVRAIPPVAVMAVVTLAIIGPWSVALSDHKDGPFLTTTSIGLGQIVGFGDPVDVAAVAGDGNPWLRWDDHIQQLALEEDIGYSSALGRERSRILSSVSATEYVRRTSNNFGGLLFRPNEFIDRFFDRYEGPPRGKGVLSANSRMVAAVAQAALWTALLIAAAAHVFLIRPRVRREFWETVVLKFSVIAVLVMPFTHPAHGRHHIVMIMAMSIMAGVAVHERGPLARPSPERQPAPFRVIASDEPAWSIVEIAIAAVVVVVGVTLAVMA